MSKIEELEKRVGHLETEIELLKELVKLQNKSCTERLIPIYPPTPISPYYERDRPHLQPPYIATCEKGKR